MRNKTEQITKLEKRIKDLESQLKESEKIGNKSAKLAIRCGSKLAQLGEILGLDPKLTGYDIIDLIVPGVKEILETKDKRIVELQDILHKNVKLLQEQCTLKKIAYYLNGIVCPSVENKRPFKELADEIVARVQLDEIKESEEDK